MRTARSARAAFALAVLIVLSAAASWAGDKHISTSGQECAECHQTQDKAWFESKHGLMSVKCVICHGSTETNFVMSPDIYRCRGCHGVQVSQAIEKLGEKNASCVICHAAHSETVEFHTKGGNK